MPTIRASVDVDVPLEFAKLEWNEFVLESLLSGYDRGLIDEEPLIDEDDVRAGDVRFSPKGEQLVEVDVRLDYTPRSVSGIEMEVSHAQGALKHDLERYRRFVADRCERLDCRHD